MTGVVGGGGGSVALAQRGIYACVCKYPKNPTNSDDLSKVDFQIEALVKRVERQYHDVESKKSADELKVREVG